MDFSHFISFMARQRRRLPGIQELRADLNGKTVIVFGANTGLGFEATQHLATMNPRRLILACRNVEKGNQALESIRETTKYTGGEVWHIDLADFASVSAFADKFEKEGESRLDIAIEGSGILTPTYRQTTYGWESTLQTNHLGTSLLAILLLPYLSKTPLSAPTPRLVIVTSDVHLWTKFTPEEVAAPHVLERLNDAKYCTPKVMGNRYEISKLLNIFFTRALAARTSSRSPVTINAVTPGLCYSGISREMTGVGSLMFALFRKIFARTTEEGGRTFVHAAVGDPAEGRATHGQYLSECEVTPAGKYVLSKDGEEMQERLWKETIDILSKVDSRVPGIVAEYLSHSSVGRSH